MKKTMIRITILLAMLLPFTPVWANADSPKPPTEKELAILSYFEIIDADADPDSTVTKLDYLVMLCKALVRDTALTAEGKNLFYDFDPTEEHAGEVEFAYNAGIVQGSEGGFLRGNAKLAPADALAMTVRALKYDAMAQAKGGYPTGYVMTAELLRLTKGLDNLYAGSLTLGQASKLLFNAMNVELMAFTSAGEYHTYKTETGKTLLNSLFNVSSVEGVITANKYVSLPAGDGVAEHTVHINDMPFNEGKSGAADFLGYRVEGFFITDDNKDKELICIDASKNTVKEFNVRDCVCYDPGKIVYYDELRQKEYEYKISAMAVTLMNSGLFYMTETLDLPEAGEFELIDNDNDNLFDVVKIKSYEVFVSAGKSADNRMIYNKNSTTEYLDMTDYKYVTIRRSDGAELSGAEKIEAGKTLFIARNAEKDFLEIITLDASVNVTVDGVAHGDRGCELTDKTSGDHYRVSPWYETIKSNPDIEVGGNYTFVLDIYGDICAVTSGAANAALNYGYLVASTDKLKALNKTVKFKIFDTAGDISVFTAASRVKTNLYGPIKAEDLAKKPVSHGLVMYGINQKGELDRLDFPLESAQEGFRLVGEAKTRNDSIYKQTSRTVGGKILLNDNTVIFSVPNDVSDEDGFGIYKGAASLRHNVRYEGMKGYSSATQTMAAEAAVVSAEVMNTISSLSSVLVVESIGEYYNADNNEAGKQIKGYMGANLKKVPVDASLPLNYSFGGKTYEVQEGDVLKYATDTRGMMVNFELVFSNAAKAVVSGATYTSTFTGEERNDVGTVMQRLDNCFKLMYTGTDLTSDNIYVVASSAIIYEYDSSKTAGKRLGLINYNQIEAAEDNEQLNSIVYVRLLSSLPSIIVVYK